MSILLRAVVWLALVLILPSTDAAIANGKALGSLAPFPGPADGSQEIKIGFYPTSVYNIDFATNTYYADGYVWLRWSGDIDPIKSLEFINAVDKDSLLKQPIYDQPEVMPDGTKYQIIRLEGRFFQSFSLAQFPLDHQKLGILVEDSMHDSTKLHYVIDAASTGCSQLLDITGWNLLGWKAETLLHDYGTTFGAEGTDAGAFTFALMRFELEIERPHNYFLWRLLLPLIIILGAAWMVLFFDPSVFDTRTAMPASALVTTVFLQQSYSNTLPRVGYLVLMDKFFALAYVLIIAVIVRAVMLAGKVDKTNPADVATVKRNDRLLFAAEILIFVLGGALIVHWR